MDENIDNEAEFTETENDNTTEKMQEKPLIMGSNTDKLDLAFFTASIKTSADGLETLGWTN